MYITKTRSQWRENTKYVRIKGNHGNGSPAGDKKNRMMVWKESPSWRVRQLFLLSNRKRFRIDVS